MIRKSKKNPEPGGPNVPAYIVTFSDMVTLLLTFFVMLLSLAQVQDPQLFNKSRDAFAEYIDCYGLGMLVGKQLVPDLGKQKPRFLVPDPDEEAPPRTIDSNEETVRRLFQKVTQSMRAIPSRVDVRLSDYDLTSIYFLTGQTQLDKSAEKYLSQFAANHRPTIDSEKCELYVLGLAPDEPAAKQQWIVSSLRAQRVAEYLEKQGFNVRSIHGGLVQGDVLLSGTALFRKNRKSLSRLSDQVTDDLQIEFFCCQIFIHTVTAVVHDSEKQRPVESYVFFGVLARHLLFKH